MVVGFLARDGYHGDGTGGGTWATPSGTCGWDDGTYGVRDNAAGQAYYDSMLALFAGWGVDFLKVDCIADHPYKASEIRQIAAAIGSHPVENLPPGFEKARVWVASGKGGRPQQFLAVFNLDDKPVSLAAAWEKLGMDPGKHVARDLWQGHRLPASETLAVQLPAHGCALYEMH